MTTAALEPNATTAVEPRLSQIGPPPTAANGNPGAGIDYELLLDCVHCGLCTASCPTYVETGPTSTAGGKESQFVDAGDANAESGRILCSCAIPS